MIEPTPPPARRGLLPRRVAAEVVERVIHEGAFVQHVLGHALTRSGLDARDRAFATELTYGTLTWLRPIDVALDRVLAQGRGSLHPSLLCLLRVATYQLGWRAEAVPAFAVIHESVEIARRDGGRRRAGLVNAVLRNMQREHAHVFQPPKKAAGALRLAHEASLPDWIAERLVGVLGADEAAEAMRAWNAPTPVVVRWRADEPAPETDVREDGVPALRPHPVVPGAYIVDGPVAALEAIAEGRAAVQDAGAQLAVACVPDHVEGRIWDACAGVGGKTKHLADRFGGARVFATDTAAAKLSRLRQEVPEVRTSVWTARPDDPTGEPEAPSDAVAAHGPFGVVLIDAPCSGLGSIGRHPDTRWNRTEDVVDHLSWLQRGILDEASAQVQPGGWLVYMVCTWTPEEGIAQIRAFLERNPAFVIESPTEESGVRWGDLVDDDGCVSVWPHRHRTDGFFLARLRRLSP